MPELAEETIERSRRNLNSILNSIAATDEARLAQSIGKDAAAIAQMKEDGRIEEIALFLAALDLKVVAATTRCVDNKTLETLLYGHRKWIESVSHPDEPSWD